MDFGNSDPIKFAYPNCLLVANLTAKLATDETEITNLLGIIK